MRSDLAELSRHVDLLLVSMREWISRQQSAGLDCAMFLEDESRQAACDAVARFNRKTLAAESDYRGAVLGARISAWNRVFYLERMLNDTREFQSLLARETNPE